VPLPLPVDPLAKETSAADLRAQTKLLLAIEHTKRSLSASSGAATCAVDALKDGLDLSASINRLRFDGLAGAVYRKIAAEVKRVVESCGLDVVEVDEVLLAGSSSLLPGLASAIEMTFPEGTPVSSVLDPSQAIAIGCALQALHLAELPTASTGALPLETLLATPTTDVSSTAKPIGLVIPGLEADFHTVIPADTPLPARRLLALPVAKGVTTVGAEFWEGTKSIKTETITPPPRSASELDSDEEDDEEDEPEEVSTVVVEKTTFLKAVSIDVKDDRKVYFEVVADREGAVSVRAWLEGEEKA
jgi:heat shock protein 1/8